MSPLVSVSMASSFPSGPSLSHKLGKKQEGENQPFPFTVTIYLIEVPTSKIIPKKCHFVFLAT